MSTFAHYLENKVLDHVLGGPDFARPATVYVGLYTVAPTDAGGGTEVTGVNYARVAVTNNDTNFPAATTVSSKAEKKNANAITFPTAGAGGYGTVVAVGIFDAATAGNLLMWASVTTPKAFDADDTPLFPALSLTFRLE